MPVVDYHDPWTWASQYNVGLHRDLAVRLHYSRAVLFEGHERVAQGMVNQLALFDTDKVLLVGAGYAWTQEWLEQMLPGIAVVATDVSSKIQGDKDQTEQADVEAALATAGVSQGSPRWVAALEGADVARSQRPVLADDILTGGGSSAVKKAAGLKGNAKFDWAITEDALPWLTDAECEALHSAAADVGALVCHLVTDHATPPSAPGNWKSLQGWKALLPNATILSRHTYEAL